MYHDTAENEPLSSLSPPKKNMHIFHSYFFISGGIPRLSLAGDGHWAMFLPSIKQNAKDSAWYVFLYNVALAKMVA